MTFANATSRAPQVKSGKLRALAVTSAEPSSLLPGLPTLAPLGLPGYQAVTINGVFAPAKSPWTLINSLNQELVKILARPAVRECYFNVGVETIGSSPEKLSAEMKAETVLFGRMIKGLGIRAE